jgi:hypothetical protein
LFKAVQGGSKEVSELLIDKGADVNTEFQGNSVLRLACGYGHKGIVEVLLDRGAETDVKERYAEITTLVACDDVGRGMIDVLTEIGDADSYLIYDEQFYELVGGYEKLLAYPKRERILVRDSFTGPVEVVELIENHRKKKEKEKKNANMPLILNERSR